MYIFYLLKHSVESVYTPRCITLTINWRIYDLDSEILSSLNCWEFCFRFTRHVITSLGILNVELDICFINIHCSEYVYKFHQGHCSLAMFFYHNLVFSYLHKTAKFCCFKVKRLTNYLPPDIFPISWACILTPN